MSKEIFGSHRINSIVIIILIALFVSVIYFPKTIWDYEDELRDEARFRMNTVTLAEKLHYQLAKSYTADPNQLVTVVNSVRDSLLAAESDTNYSFYGPQKISLPGRSVTVNYSDEYRQFYSEQHLELFKLLKPHHFMDSKSIKLFLDTVRTGFEQGNYTGEQSLEIDSVMLSFEISEKYDILYQNIKTSMFNALTGSFTRYPDFSNPLVDAVLDSIKINPALSGRVDFNNIYDGSVRIDFIIPFKFAENLEKTKLVLKKQFVIDSYDSATYGDTLYNMALAEFMIQNDTLEFMPDYLTLMYADTSEEIIEIPVEIKVEDMEIALAKRRNTLYTMLTGYDEPSETIANHVINVALDSLESPGVGVDSIHLDIDLTDAVFNINIHDNIIEYFNKVSLDQAYYKTFVNLADLDWNQSAIEVVEYVATALKRKSDYKKWQVVEASTDTFYVDVFDEYLRKYDDMNLALYEKLTGEFSNVFDFASELVAEAEHLASVDSLNWSGAQVIEFEPDTVLVDVFPLYLEEYDNTFTISRDTVVRAYDSTFIGVWARSKIGVTQDFSIDSLNFLIAMDNSEYRYSFEGTDSVRSMNVLGKSDTARVERVYSGMDSYIMIFSDDSVMENLYRITDEAALFDSIQIDSLFVVSDEFVVGEQEKDLFMAKDSFGGWQDTVISKKYTKKELFSSYLLTPMHTRCTVTDLPYRITIRYNVHQTIESPIQNPIETRRYLFFTQSDSSHGSIEDGEESWVK
ncbi:MAG: hypothetical protein U9Q77_08635 [Candidatus Marinimicrobia bacterium]|nr:hypothetical protein [Candidatus Neomarinimicrobiota bacterium]